MDRVLVHTALGINRMSQIYSGDEAVILFAGSAIFAPARMP